MPNFYNLLRARKFNTTADTALEIAPYGSATPNFTIDAGGKMRWSSGSATPDTTLYRSAADVLKTDDSFDIASGKTYKVDGTDVLTSDSIFPTSNSISYLGGNTGITKIMGGLAIKQVQEITITDGITNLSSSATDIDVLTGSIYHFTGTPSANFAINIRGNSTFTNLNDVLANGHTMTMTIIVDKAANTYKLSTVNINGSSQTINWFGGTAPSAGNALDIYSITVLKTGSSTYKVFASQAKFAQQVFKVPFLNSQGSFKPGRGFFAAGTIPGPPTFVNTLTTVTEQDNQLTVSFVAPAFNGRTSDYWI